MEKMFENAVSAYKPKIEEMANARKLELEDLRSKVRTNPEQVESWFDKEIEKLGQIDVIDVLGKMK